MFLALFPRDETFVALANVFNEISSNLWDSRVVDERELVSPDALEVSFLDPNFDLHVDLPFSGGATSGTVTLLARGVGSRVTVEVIRSILGSRKVTESGEKGGSPAESRRESGIFSVSNPTPSIKVKEAMPSTDDSPEIGLLVFWG